MDNSEWKVVTKSKKQKKTPKDVPIVKDIKMSDEPKEDDLKLFTSYTLWCHDTYNKDWSLQSYKKMYTINTVSDFWKVYNNLNKMGYKSNNFFLMKHNIDPIWEHPNNRNGGLCSFKVETEHALSVFENLSMRMLCGMLTDNHPNELEDINGVSFSSKNSWTIIKIWNSDKKYDISKMLKKEITNTYKNTSIIYKENAPEY